jgi:protocatechuate 3,4-dioxygenase beta subunit
MFAEAIKIEKGVKKMSRTKQIESRRNFLKRVSVAALAIPFIVGCKDAVAENVSDELSLIKKNANRGGEGYGARDAPDNVSWKSVLSKTSDRDEPMIVSGTVFQADGKTPAPNILIYFYHTDAAGIYGRSGEPGFWRRRAFLSSIRRLPLLSI